MKDLIDFIPYNFINVGTSMPHKIQFVFMFRNVSIPFVDFMPNQNERKYIQNSKTTAAQHENMYNKNSILFCLSLESFSASSVWLLQMLISLESATRFLCFCCVFFSSLSPFVTDTVCWFKWTNEWKATTTTKLWKALRDFCVACTFHTQFTYRYCNYLLSFGWIAKLSGREREMAYFT